MTRARERLYLTCCRRRRIAGRYQDQAESPFLQELPDQLLEVKHSPDLYQPTSATSERTQGIYSFFGQGGERPAGASGRAARRAPRRPSPAAVLHGRSADARAVAPGRPAAATSSPTPHEVARRAAPSSAAAASATPPSAPAWSWSWKAQGDEARLTVFFEKAGKRKLVAKFANLEML